MSFISTSIKYVTSMLFALLFMGEASLGCFVRKNIETQCRSQLELTIKKQIVG